MYYEGEDRKEYLRLVHAQFMYTVLLIQEKDSKRVLSPLYVFAERLDRDFAVNSKFDEKVLAYIYKDLKLRVEKIRTKVSAYVEGKDGGQFSDLDVTLCLEGAAGSVMKLCDKVGGRDHNGAMAAIRKDVLYSLAADFLRGCEYNDDSEQLEIHVAWGLVDQLMRAILADEYDASDAPFDFDSEGVGEAVSGYVASFRGDFFSFIEEHLKPQMLVNFIADEVLLHDKYPTLKQLHELEYRWSLDSDQICIVKSLYDKIDTFALEREKVEYLKKFVAEIWLMKHIFCDRLHEEEKISEAFDTRSYQIHSQGSGYKIDYQSHCSDVGLWSHPFQAELKMTVPDLSAQDPLVLDDKFQKVDGQSFEASNRPGRVDDMIYKHAAQIYSKCMADGKGFASFLLACNLSLTDALIIQLIDQSTITAEVVLADLTASPSQFDDILYLLKPDLFKIMMRKLLFRASDEQRVAFFEAILNFDEGSDYWRLFGEQAWAKQNLRLFIELYLVYVRQPQEQHIGYLRKSRDVYRFTNYFDYIIPPYESMAEANSGQVPVVQGEGLDQGSAVNDGDESQQYDSEKGPRDFLADLQQLGILDHLDEFLGCVPKPV